MKLYRLLPLLAMAAVAASCEDKLSSVPPATLVKSLEIVLENTEKAKLFVDATGSQTLPLVVGESVTLGYVSDPDDLSTVTYPQVKWTSSDEDVLVADKSGKLTAVAPGTAIVTLSPETVNVVATSSIKITVVASVTNAESITISDSSEHESEFAPDLPSCYIGETMALTAVVSPADATYQTVLWSSGDETIATVDPITGVVTGVAQGEVELVATSLDAGKVTAVHKIYIDKVIMPEGIRPVNAPAADEVFSLSDIERQIEFETYPEVSTKSLITWKTSDEAVATVDAKGKVRFRKYGTVTVTASCPETETVMQEGFAPEMSVTLNIAAGFYRDSFISPSVTLWKADTNGASMETLENEYSEHYLYFSPVLASGKGRCDFKRDQTTYLSGSYPILVFRLDDVKDLGYTGRSIAVDVNNGYVDNSGSTARVYYGRIGGAGSDKWKEEYKCSDGSRIFVYDLASQNIQNGGALPSEGVVVFPNFKLVYADILPSTDLSAAKYRFFGFRTFKSSEEFNTYLTDWSAGTQITYEKIK